MANFWESLPKPFLVLAPMEDVTDMAFRELMATFSPPDVFFTEFVSADGIIHNQSGSVLQKLRFSKNQRPIVAQIWGTNLKNLETAAQKVTELGFDGIDINMGCPAKDVVKIGGGAGQIKDFAGAVKVIKAVRGGAFGLPVSVKTRLGFDKIIAKEWLSLLLEQKLAALTVHGRTAKQMSKGKADWEEIGKAVKLKNKISPETLIIGNGDTESFEEVLEKHRSFGVDGVMIGRGVFKNPLVFSRDQRSLTKEERIALLNKHLDLIRLYGGSLNKFFKMYLHNFPGAKELRIKYLSDIIT